METVLLNAGGLPQFIVTKPGGYAAEYVRGSDNGIVHTSEASVFSPLAKIEVERSTRNPNKYVHLRFCHYNKYWGRAPDVGISIVSLLAEASEPEEDITKLSCTLFEAVKVRNDPTNTLFNLIHVQSRGYVMGIGGTGRLYLRMPIPNPVIVDAAMSLIVVNWENLVKLPTRIALKGHNDKYLAGRRLLNLNSLQLWSDDGKAKESIHEVHLMNDGHVRIKSIHSDRFWRRNPSNNWIVVDATNTTASIRDRDTLFWPVHNSNEGDAIALRNAGNNQFCIAHNTNDYLSATGTSMTNQTKLIVEELVFGRRIYNVKYRVDNSRIFNEAPYVAGTTTAQNNGNTEANMAVEVTYEESRSETFTRSISFTAGVTISLESQAPIIVKKGVSFTFETSVSKEWGTTTTITKSVKAKGSVPVPPRSVATISYVGTVGTCDVPFTYTQQAQSSVDGSFDRTDKIDGVFRGVNAYDFQFVINETRSLPLPNEVMLPAATESSDAEAL